MDKISQFLKILIGIFTVKEVAPIFTSSTTTGTIAAGFSKISIFNSGAGTGTVTSAGTTYTMSISEIINLDPGFLRKNERITFDATGTTFKIISYR